MKKLLSVIIALSMCASVMTLSAGTASAATVDNQAVSKADMTSELEAELNKMSANDTVAVVAYLSTSDATGNVDPVAFAKANGLEDQIELDENGNINNYTSEFLRAFIDHLLGLSLEESDRQYNIVKENYCQSVLHYERTNNFVVCVSTKAQVEAMAQSDGVTEILLSDKTYALEDKVTWDEFYKMNDNVRKAYSQLKGVECTADKYDITFGEYVNDSAFMVVVSEHDMNFTIPVIARANDIVWTQNALDSDMFMYENGNLYTLGDFYRQGKIDFAAFKEAGGKYYGDINNDDVVDVNDVTQLQLILADGSESNPLFEILSGFQSAYNDVNLDTVTDVNDVTTLQMYLAGYNV